MNPNENSNSVQFNPAVSSVTFTGNASEYFRIWVVNIFLSIVTLGIYSAWATVRTKKYFYQNTQLFGHGFDFHAKPVKILKSRIIAVAIYIVYMILTKISPVLGIIGVASFYLALPSLILASMQFRMSNTSYRGIRFSFAGKRGEAYVTYLLLPIASLLSAGLALPYLSYRAYRYWLSGTRYGTKQFVPELSVKQFYLIYLKLLGLLALGAAALSLLLSLFSTASSAIYISLLPLSFMLVIWFVISPYLKARTLTHVYGHTHIGSVSFESSLRFRGLFWLTLTNFILIAISIGLLLPYVKVRNARYMADRTTVTSNTALDEFIADMRKDSSATGDEVADILNIDVPAIG